VGYQLAFIRQKQKKIKCFRYPPPPQVFFSRFAPPKSNFLAFSPNSRVIAVRQVVRTSSAHVRTSSCTFSGFQKKKLKKKTISPPNFFFRATLKSFFFLPNGILEISRKSYDPPPKLLYICMFKTHL
jgi:hypothetical protein